MLLRKGIRQSTRCFRTPMELFIGTVPGGGHILLFVCLFVFCECLTIVGVLVIYLPVFTVFCIVCTVLLYCFVKVYLFLFVLSVLT